MRHRLLLLLSLAGLAVLVSSCITFRSFPCDRDLIQDMSKVQLILYYFHCTPKQPTETLGFAVLTYSGKTRFYQFKTPAEAMRSINLINANTWNVFKLPAGLGYRWLQVTFKDGKATDIKEVFTTKDRETTEIEPPVGNTVRPPIR